MIKLSQLTQQNIFVQESVKTSNSPPHLLLATGEFLEAFVLGYDHNHKVLLQIKNSTLTADCHSPLQKGEKLTLNVAQLHPSIILKIIGHETSDPQKVNEFLKMFRSNPEALKDLITKTKDLFTGKNSVELSNYIDKKDLQLMIKLLDKIIIDKRSVTNSLLIKDYIEALGLTFEKNLRKALSDPTILSNEKKFHNLKEILLKISSSLQNQQTFPDLNGVETKEKIAQVLNLSEMAGKLIEQIQIFNSIALEQDNIFMLQIPFQYPDGIRMQDIFIEADSKRTASSADKKYRVVLFLSMDILGEVAVDASIRNRNLNCTIKCENQEVCNFISSLLPDLQEKLSSISYNVASLKCICECHIPSLKRDFLSEHNFFSQSTINLSI
jgi:hypothetical protein